MSSEQLNPATQQQPLVSVITPFYNTGQYIAECIESVLAQTYSHWEYILVNNQSTDSSRSIAERYAREDNRIRLLDTPNFLSQGENFNAALHHISPESGYCQVLLAEIVRKTQPFYPEGWLHDDTEACFRVLQEYDLGFIHQVLTFSRKDEDSITSKALRFGPGPLRRYMFAVQYGPQFFSGDEYRQYLKRETDFYGEFLAASVFEFKKKEFWDFHRKGLRTIGADFGSVGLAKHVLYELADIILNPKKTIGRVIRLFKNSPPKPKESSAPAPSATKEQSTSP